LVNVVEEEGDRLGRWFARYGDEGETFACRLLNGTDELQISMTENFRQLADNIAEIQGHIGRNIQRISGGASVGLEQVIKSGRFNSDLYAMHLSGRLGGRWRVEVIKRPAANDVWDVIATRLGD
jgi:hypothetical protein